MSYKNRSDIKQLRRLSRALQKGRLPSYIDLIEWLQDRGHANTASGAKKLLFERRVRCASHPLGFRIVDVLDEDQKPTGEKQEIFCPLVDSKFSPEIQVIERG